MCGIVGVFGSDHDRPAEASLLHRMAEAIAHRGPDGGGFHADGSLGLGMRRLSIIDLKTGEQPLADEDQKVWVVFNGEIYNYRELRRDLVERGHRFSTASDTEVLVHLYEEEGEECVARLRGMFAFALWDSSRRALLLARDRLGIKPLYYAETPQGLVFGSELKAVVRSPWVSRRVDRRALASFLRYGYVPDPLSILEGVSKLPPGHTLMVREGHAGVPRCYWEPTPFFHPPGPGPSEAEAAEQLWSLLRDAVRSHLVSDVPVGAFLSGGVDSSAIVAVMAREAGARIKTFSIGFREQGFDELPYARRVARWCGTDHHERIVEPRDLEVLEEVLAAVDEPFCDPSALPTYLVSRLAREHVKVVLSGDGGDELFAGYDRYLVDHRRRLLGLAGDHGLGAPLRAMSAALPDGAPGKNYLYHLSLPRMERYLDSISLFPARAMRRILDGEASCDAESVFAPAMAAGQGLDPLSRLQDFDLRTNLPGDILTKLDRMTMANSLEGRVPFLDHPLVEFACGLPARLRLRSGRTKYLLKRALQGRVPEEALTRPKQGFGVPLEVWFSEHLPGFFSDMLGDGARLASAGIRPTHVQALLDLYARRGRWDHRHQLWGLVVLDRSLAGLAEVAR